METILLLAFQLAGPVSIGLAITCYLRAVTLRLLTDVCGTRDRAEFWVRVSAVLTVCMPLSLVLLAATSPVKCLSGDPVCEELVVRQTFLFTLLGSLLSVAAVACMIARYLPQPQASTKQPVTASAQATAQSTAEAA